METLVLALIAVSNLCRQQETLEPEEKFRSLDLRELRHLAFVLSIFVAGRQDAGSLGRDSRNAMIRAARADLGLLVPEATNKGWYL